MEKDNLAVGGYLFNNQQDAETAVAEMDKAEYFSQKVDRQNGKSMLAVYDKLMDSKYFKTPIGWEYMKKLQEDIRNTEIESSKIRSIPLYIKFSYLTGEELEQAKIIERIKNTNKKKKGSKGLTTSIFLNILLVIMVGAMFAITLKSESPNIINYKQALTNQYASWDQELTKREQVLREKESELGVVTTADRMDEEN